MNDNRIMFSLEWFKGIYMSVPNSKFLRVCIGLSLLLIGAAFATKMVISAIAPEGLVYAKEINRNSAN